MSTLRRIIITTLAAAAVAANAGDVYEDGSFLSYPSGFSGCIAYAPCDWQYSPARLVWVTDEAANQAAAREPDSRPIVPAEEPQP